MPLGFILQPTYRIERGVPVVNVWGVLEDGSPFLLRDDRDRPTFWIRDRDVEAARRRGARVAPHALTAEDLEGEPVRAIVLPVPARRPTRSADASPGRGIRTYEADVRFAVRYLLRAAGSAARSASKERAAPSTA